MPQEARIKKEEGIEVGKEVGWQWGGVGGDEDVISVLLVGKQRTAALHLQPLSKEGLDGEKNDN